MTSVPIDLPATITIRSDYKVDVVRPNCPTDHFFSEHKFWSSAYFCLSYDSYLKYLEEYVDGDPDEDVQARIDFLKENADKDAGLSIVTLPIGDLLLVGKTYRQVFDLLEERLNCPAIHDYEKICIVNGSTYVSKLWQFAGFDEKGYAQFETH
jgi:hypothetical protein